MCKWCLFPTSSHICECLSKTRLVCTKTEFNFIAAVYRHTSIPSVSSVKFLLVCFSQGHFADPPVSRLEQWNPWKAPIGQWRPVFALTGCVAHWCVIGHCVGIMAARGVSLGVTFATSLPTHLSPSHPTPLRHPFHPPPLLSILMAERDGKKYLEIQPSETEKVSYNKN